MKPQNIRLFVKSGCGWCDAAQEWLDEQGIKYAVVNVSRDAKAFSEMQQLSGQTRAPVIEIDGEILADFGPEELEVFWQELTGGEK